MPPIETQPATTVESARTRLPHVIGVAAGIAILAGVVLLWTGQSAEPTPSTHSALGSTLNLDSPTPAHAKPNAVASTSKPDIATGDTPKEDGVSSDTPQTDTHVELETAILGTWKQYSYGHRLLNVKPDGTATIDVKLDGLSAVAFGEKLRIDIAWEIQDQTLVFKTTGGTPEASLNAVKSIYGDNRVYQILEINEKQMLLREGEEDKTPWDRVVEE